MPLAILKLVTLRIVVLLIADVALANPLATEAAIALGGCAAGQVISKSVVDSTIAALVAVVVCLAVMSARDRLAKLRRQAAVVPVRP